MISSAIPLSTKVNPNSAVKLVQDLHEDLIQALLQSADLFQPTAQLTDDKRTEMYWDKYFFVMLLNHSAVYKRNVSQYIKYLAKDFKNIERFDSVLTAEVFSNGNETGQLFRQPYRAMSRYYKDRESFGIGTYNINSYLRILFKIKFLQEASARPFMRKEWFAIKYQRLAAEVRQFKRWVKDKNITAIINKIDADSDNEPQESGKQLFTTRFRFIEENSFCPDSPFGEIDSSKMWFQLWRTEHSHPLQMPFAELYPWHERVSYFFLGSDVRKYFYDYRRWFKADVDSLSNTLAESFVLDKNRFSSGVRVGVRAGIFAANLFIMLLLNLPLAFLKGVLSLPLRAAHEMTSISLGGYPEKTLVIGLHGLRLLLTLALAPLGITALLTVSTVSAILSYTATLLMLPVTKWMLGFFKPNANAVIINHTLSKLKLIVAKESNRKCFIDEGRLTLKSLDHGSYRAQNNAAFFLNGLIEKILRKESLELRFYDLMPKQYYWLVGRNALDNDKFHAAPGLVFDWSVHGDPPTEEQLAEIAEHLKERLVALTEFQLVGEFDHSLVFCDILIKNVKLEPEVVSFGRELTFIHLSNLINLLKHKPSIKFIASLPEDKRLIPAKYLEKYEQIKILLKYNKQMKVHLQPTVITEVEREGYQMVVLHNSPSRSLTDNSLFSNATPARKQVYAVDDMRLPPPSWSKFK